MNIKKNDVFKSDIFRILFKSTKASFLTSFSTFLIIFSSLLFSCTTALYYEAERPAQVDLHGATSIAILPFRVGERGNEFAVFGHKNEAQKDFADYITSKLTKTIVDGKYFSVIEARRFENALHRMGVSSLGTSCDVYISGNIINWDEKIEKEDRSDGENTKVAYKKTVRTTVVYQIIEVETNQVLAREQKNFLQTSSWYDGIESLPKSDVMLRFDADNMIKQIMKEIQPYTVSNRIDLMKNDKKIFPDDNSMFEVALSLAKKGMYESAEQSFLAMYDKTPMNFYAGYDAAVMMLVQKNFEQAKALLEDVLEEYLAWEVQSSENELGFAKKLDTEDFQRKVRKAYVQCETEMAFQKKLENQRK